MGAVWLTGNLPDRVPSARCVGRCGHHWLVSGTCREAGRLAPWLSGRAWGTGAAAGGTGALKPWKHSPQFHCCVSVSGLSDLGSSSIGLYSSSDTLYESLTLAEPQLCSPVYIHIAWNLKILCTPNPRIATLVQGWFCTLSTPELNFLSKQY